MSKIIRGKLSNFEIGYIAGLIDGEGCIGIHKHTDKRGSSRLHYLYVIVSNNNPKCTEFLKDNFGGWITKRQQKKEWNINYKWGLRSGKAKEFLTIIYPYLLLKKEQALLGIKFDDNKIRYKLSDEEWNKREKYYLQMRQLNSKYTKIKPHHMKLQPQRLNEKT